MSQENDKTKTFFRQKITKLLKRRKPDAVGFKMARADEMFDYCVMFYGKYAVKSLIRDALKCFLHRLRCQKIFSTVEDCIDNLFL